MMDRKPMNKQETQHNQDQEDEKVLADGPSKKNLKKIQFLVLIIGAVLE